MNSLANSIFKPPKLDHLPAIQHGRIYENTALEKFEAATGKKVKPCGLFIDPQYPHLGASPDAVLQDEGAVVEVKCSYKGKDSMIEPGKKFDFLEFVGHDKFQLKRTHRYYYQVVGEMQLSRRNKCYFVVYTLKDLWYEEIKLDEDFFKSNMLPALTKFYEEHYLPIVASSLLK